MTSQQKFFFRQLAVFLSLGMFFIGSLRGCGRQENDSDEYTIDKQIPGDNKIIMSNQGERDEQKDQTTERATSKTLDPARREKLAKVLPEVERIAAQMDGERLQAIAYNQLSLVQTKWGDPKGAEKSFEQALTILANLQPFEDRYFTYCEFAYAQVQAGNKANAEKCFAWAEENINKVGSQNVAIHIVGARARTGDIRKALKLADQMAGRIDNEFLKDMLYADIIREQVKKGDIAGALKTAEKIHNYLVIERVNGLIGVAQAEAGDIEAALRTGKKLRSDEFKVMLYRKIARAQSQVGQIEQAFQTSAKITSPFTKKMAYLDIIEVQLQMGNIDKTLRLIEQISDIDDRGAFYSMLSRYQVQSEDFEGAVRTSQKTDNPMDLLGTYAIIGQTQFEKGNKQKAAETIELAKAVIENNKDALDENTAYREIALYYISIGDFENAKNYTEVMIDWLYENSISYIIWAIVYARNGKLESAIYMADIIDSMFVRGMVYCDIILSQFEVEAMLWAKPGEFNQAVNINGNNTDFGLRALLNRQCLR
ncbi:MAG: hypothetical protein AMJ79_14520 [Phycisphaerae bacterium SM23_30]|nr:MAG: hypothetical protein AMJ79_14520 [Phycisphaerae bacterium SM23_30]